MTPAPTAAPSTKRCVQVYRPDPGWDVRMLVITARCGHQWSTSTRVSPDLCVSVERLLDHHERLCTEVPGFWDAVLRV